MSPRRFVQRAVCSSRRRSSLTKKIEVRAVACKRRIDSRLQSSSPEAAPVGPSPSRHVLRFDPDLVRGTPKQRNTDLRYVEPQKQKRLALDRTHLELPAHHRTKQSPR